MTESSPSKPNKSFSFEARGSLYKDTLLTQVYPWKKDVFEKISTKGVSISLPMVHTKGDKDSKEGRVECDIGSDSQKVTYQNKTTKVVTMKKESGKTLNCASISHKLNENITVQLKTAEKNGNRDYAMAANMKFRDFQMHMKVHPQSLFGLASQGKADIKGSAFFGAGMLKVGADMCANLSELHKVKYNVAVGSPCTMFGRTVSAATGYSSEHDEIFFLTSQKTTCDYKVEMGMDLRIPRDGINQPLSSLKLATIFGIQLMPCAHMKVKVNSVGDLATRIKCTTGNGCTYQMGVLTNIWKDKNTFLSPELGFKVSVKG